MFNPVYPINNRPIIVKTDVDYQFTQIVVDKVEAEDGQYDVMFIGTGAHSCLVTPRLIIRPGMEVKKWNVILFSSLSFFFLVDMGTILKVVSIPRGSWHDLEEVLLEEMTVFRVSPIALGVFNLRVCLARLILIRRSCSLLAGADGHQSNGALNQTGIVSKFSQHISKN